MRRLYWGSGPPRSVMQYEWPPQRPLLPLRASVKALLLQLSGGYGCKMLSVSLVTFFAGVNRWYAVTYTYINIWWPFCRKKKSHVGYVVFTNTFFLLYIFLKYNWLRHELFHFFFVLRSVILILEYYVLKTINAYHFIYRKITCQTLYVQLEQ